MRDMCVQIRICWQRARPLGLCVREKVEQPQLRVSVRFPMSRLLLVPVCKRALPICSQSSTNGHSTNGMQTGHPVCFQCVFSARLHPSLAWSKRALRPDTNGKFPFVLRASFVPTSFFANGLPVCSRRVARTPPKVTAPAASVGSALRLREWVLIFATWRRRRCPRSDGQCPFASRMQMGKVPFAPRHIYARPQTGSARLWTSATHSLSSRRRPVQSAIVHGEPRGGTNGTRL